MRLRLQDIWSQRLQRVVRRETRRDAAISGEGAQPVDAAWDEAFLRVESYLRAHHIESRLLLTRLTSEILDTARELITQFPSEAPVTTAMRVAQARIGDWFQRAMGEGDWSDDRFRARGRLALLMSELPQRAPEHFLSPDPLPAGERDCLSGARLQPGPDMRPTGMPPAPLEFPLAGMVEKNWVTFSRSTFNRAVASWALFIGFLGVAWVATR